MLFAYHKHGILHKKGQKMHGFLVILAKNKYLRSVK